MISMGNKLRIALIGAVLLLPVSANAYTFTFGDSIAASDNITSITLAADGGGGGATFEFTTATDRIDITASVSQINFSNRAPISGIPTGELLFTSTIFRTSAYTFIPPFFPEETFADFTNGVADFTIWDDPGGGSGGPIKILEGDYDGSGLRLNVKIQVGVILGELSGDFTVTGGNADVVSAWGPGGTIDELFTIGTDNGNGNLCPEVVTDCAPFGVDWVDFDANPTSTLIPVPEPGSAALFGTLAMHFLYRRRARR